jgi:DNA-directed RNA polymerase subunit N (RpoN/RPB10)
MIIPVRCFTCGKVIADKWVAYDRKCRDAAAKAGDGPATEQQSGRSEARNVEERAVATGLLNDTYRRKVLDDLDITKMCCIRHMLTHKDLIDII